MTGKGFSGLLDRAISVVNPQAGLRRAAARNAAKLTSLSKKERNIILSHMWPLGGALPRSIEAWLVDLVDTLCAGVEFSHLYHPRQLREQLGVKPIEPQTEPELVQAS